MGEKKRDEMHPWRCVDSLDRKSWWKDRVVGGVGGRAEGSVLDGVDGGTNVRLEEGVGCANGRRREKRGKQRWEQVVRGPECSEEGPDSSQPRSAAGGHHELLKQKSRWHRRSGSCLAPPPQPQHRLWPQAPVSPAHMDLTAPGVGAGGTDGAVGTRQAILPLALPGCCFVWPRSASGDGDRLSDSGSALGGIQESSQGLLTPRRWGALASAHDWLQTMSGVAGQETCSWMDRWPNSRVREPGPAGPPSSLPGTEGACLVGCPCPSPPSKPHTSLPWEPPGKTWGSARLEALWGPYCLSEAPSPTPHPSAEPCI